MEFLWLVFVVNLFIGETLSAWSYVPNQAKNWDNARADCQSQGGDLATFATPADFTAAINFIQSIDSTPPKDLWTGLRLDTSSGTSAPYIYQWPDGTVASYFEWDTAIGEPDAQSVDHCVRLYVGGWKWRTKGCSSSYDYICDGVAPAVTTTTTVATTTAPVTTTPEATTEEDIEGVTGSLDDYWSWDEVMADTGYIGLVFGFGFTFCLVTGICVVWFMCCIRKKRLEEAEQKKREFEKFEKEQLKKSQKPVFAVGQKMKYTPQNQDVLFS